VNTIVVVVPMMYFLVFLYLHLVNSDKKKKTLIYPLMIINFVYLVSVHFEVGLHVYVVFVLL